MGNKGAKEALLDYAREFLRENPAQDFKTQEALDSTKTSFSSLYHHFGSREGLIQQAQISLIRELTSDFHASVFEVIDQIKNFDDFALFFSSATHRQAIDPEFQNGRKLVAKLIGIGMADEVVRKALIQDLQKRIDLFTPLFVKLQQKGILNLDLNIPDFIGFWSALSISRVFMEIDPLTSPVLPEWNQIFISTLLRISSPTGDFAWDKKYALRISNPIPESENRPLIPFEDIPNEFDFYTPLKKNMISETIKLLDIKSPEDLKLQDVAAQMEISASLILKYFADKEDLLNCANKHRYVYRTITTPEDWIELSRAKAPSELNNGLKNIFKKSCYLKYPENEGSTNAKREKSIAQVRWEVLSSVFSNPEIKEEVIKYTRNSTLDWKGLVEPLQESGFLDQGISAYGLNYWAFSAFQGFPLFALMRDGFHSPERLEDLYWSMLMGVRGRA